MLGRHMARGMRAIALALPLLLAACGSNAPPRAETPATPLATAPRPATPSRRASPWPNSRFFTPIPAAPTPLFSRPKRPIRGPAVHTLRS